MRPFSLKYTLDTLKDNFKVEQAEFLKTECEQKPKLRTFMTFKQFNSMPAYVTKPLSFLQKKHLSKLRLGSLELRIKSGRFSRPPLEIHKCVCFVCRDTNLGLDLQPEIETEAHFLFFCGHYDNLRNAWLADLVKPENFQNLDEGSKLSVVLNAPENVKKTAQFIINAYNMRSKKLNK